MNIEKFITDIKFNLMRTHYWYASVLMQMPVLYDDPDVNTFAVGKKNKQDSQISLFICSKYVETMAGLCHDDRRKMLDHFTEILKHEVHHLIFGHLTLDLSDHERKMIACELSVNSYIDRNKLIPTDPGTAPGIFPEDFNFPPQLGALEYYQILSQQQEGKGQNGQGRNEQEQDGQGKDGQGQDGQNRNEQEQDGQGKDGNSPSLDSHEKWKGMENSQVAKIEIQSMIRNANQAVREAGFSYGNMPGELQTMIQAYDEDEPPVVPWEIILKNFLASASETVLDYTMRRPSKRYGTRPGTKKEDILSIAIGIDTSGSITQDMIQLFFKELYWIEKTGNKMTIFEWDTKIQREYDFKDYDGTVSGGGGTDPTDFLDTVVKRKHDCAIIFTDLCFGDISKDYHLPMMWVDTSDVNRTPNSHLPVQGTVLKVNRSRDGFVLLQK